MLDEVVISRAIIERFTEKLLDHLELDAAIVGGGPSGLVAGYMLAKAGHKVAVRAPSSHFGGGQCGGAAEVQRVGGP